MPRLTVFTGSRRGVDRRYAAAAEALGRRLAARGVGLVYGGGQIGLMGVVADAALSADGEVIGVIAEHMLDAETAHSRVTRLEVVTDMHTRKTRMAQLGDASLALPGGIGTLEELFEIWTRRQLGLHDNPFGLLDVAGFWEPLLGMADHMVETGFLSAGTRQQLLVVTEPDEAIDRLLPQIR